MKFLMMTIAWLALGFGVIGIFLPVIPTTPLVLLSAFLFGKSSPRMNLWIKNTRVYKSYVKPFKDGGGITKRKKAHIIGVSYIVLLISAIVVDNIFVRIILACVAAFLAYLMLIRIPTSPNPSPVKFVDIEEGEAAIADIKDSAEDLSPKPINTTRPS